MRWVRAPPPKKKNTPCIKPAYRMQYMQFPFITVSPNTRQVYNGHPPSNTNPFLVYSSLYPMGSPRELVRESYHYPHRGVDAGRHGCRTTEYRSALQTPFSPSIKCNVLRESLSEDSQNMYSLRYTKEKGVLGNLYISLGSP